MFFWKRQTKNKTLGETGEDAAAAYLRREGYRILERNFCNSRGKRLGEIDIIAEKEGALHFVEVKSSLKSSREAVLPEERINRQKLFRCQKAADYYIRRHQYWDKPCHFDALSILVDPVTGSPETTHLKDIFI